MFDWLDLKWTPPKNPTRIPIPMAAFLGKGWYVFTGHQGVKHFVWGEHFESTFVKAVEEIIEGGGGMMWEHCFLSYSVGLSMLLMMEST